MNETPIFINVDNGHQLHINTLGSKEGYPILFIHGGPGYGFFKQDSRFFNPDKHFVILYDQRGCGQSTPYASVEHNTTQDLINDIDTILDHFDLSEVCLFGGSWGSTLALLYAMKSPDRVKRMVLRGIFSAAHDTIDIFDEPNLPEQIVIARKRALDLVPMDHQDDPIGYYLSKMRDGTKKEQVKYAFELELYGAVLNFPSIPIDRLELDIYQRDYFPHAILLAHYAHNKFFIEDQFIWNNLKLIEGIPIDIIHGSHDQLCPVDNAYRLHEEMINSKLHILEAGHSALDPVINQKLKEVMSSLG
ncbi:MAG: alpha/beta fold hydrolase [Saprospiraceae bacterium]|nr:alpha/beta fold hydrolase [Saprospiraceae bacterium]